MSAAAATSWQPVETAPIDGSWVLLYAPGWPVWSYPLVGWRHAGDDEWEFPGQPQLEGTLGEPTHWMPLPPPPPAKNGADVRSAEGASAADDNA